MAEKIANFLPDPKERDWHAQRSEDEPRCSADQWRQRDRSQILYISEMEDRHLGHCIRFASTKPQHRSRLSALLVERSRRALAAEAALAGLRQSILDAEIQSDDDEKAQARLDRLAAAIRAQGE